MHRVDTASGGLEEPSGIVDAGGGLVAGRRSRQAVQEVTDSGGETVDRF